MLCKQNPLVPDAQREHVVGHIVMVHQSVGIFSRDFQHKLRRSNYVTPKNYLDYINTYLRLLDEKDKSILILVCKITRCLNLG
jgi:dynein heavy chain